MAALAALRSSREIHRGRLSKTPELRRWRTTRKPSPNQPNHVCDIAHAATVWRYADSPGPSHPIEQKLMVPDRPDRDLTLLLRETPDQISLRAVLDEIGRRLRTRASFQ